MESFTFILVILATIVVVFVLRFKKEGSPPMRKIKETKCTCRACGNVWYYGKAEQLDNFSDKLINAGNSMSNTGSDMMCCGGCLPAAFLPKNQIKDVKDLNKCPKCNSSAIQKEIVEHRID